MHRRASARRSRRRRRSSRRARARRNAKRAPLSLPPAIQAAVLGIVQGVTEFLPVSSTAHLLIVGKLLGFDDPIFTIMIQLGSIFAVVWLYRHKLMEVVQGLPTQPSARRFAIMLVVAVLPALVAGAALSGFVTRVLYRTLLVNAVTFVVGGIIILI